MDQAPKRNAGNQTRLPLTHIHRILKGGLPPYGKASKDAKQAVQEVLQDFIGFVTREANAICQRDKRKVIGGDDIVEALRKLGMNMHSDILREYQKNYRRSLAAPSRRDGMTVAGQESFDDDVDYFIPDGYQNPVDSVYPGGDLSDNLAGMQNTSKDDENSNPGGTERVQEMSTSKAFVGDNHSVGNGSTTPYMFLAMRKALGEVDMKSANEEQLRYGFNTGINQ